jgi:hypothetical protein
METLQTVVTPQEIDLSVFGFRDTVGTPIDTTSDQTFPGVLGNTEPFSLQPLVGNEPAATTSSTEEPFSFSKEDVAQTETTTDDVDSTVGRKKIGKDALVEYLAAKVNDGVYAVWEDYKDDVPVTDYLSSLPAKKLQELLDENITNSREAALKEKEDVYTQEILAALPEQFQAAYEYARNGGQDWDSFYAAMGAANRTAQLDPNNEDHQVEIAREYLYATNFGDAALIEDQLAEWKTSGRLADRVQQFKPALDNMRAQELEAYNRQQQEQNRLQEEAAKQFISNVATTIKTGDIAGIKLDIKKQKDVYKALTIADQPSIFGATTTSLGAKIENLMYVNPDPAKLALVELLLSDQEAFFKAVGQPFKNEQVAEDFKKLKMVNQAGNASTGGAPQNQEPKPKIKKIQTNSFSDLLK